MFRNASKTPGDLRYIVRGRVLDLLLVRRERMEDVDEVCDSAHSYARRFPLRAALMRFSIRLERAKRDNFFNSCGIALSSRATSWMAAGHHVSSGPYRAGNTQSHLRGNIHSMVELKRAARSRSHRHPRHNRITSRLKVSVLEPIPQRI